jgi:hypothetical protein
MRYKLVLIISKSPHSLALLIPLSKASLTMSLLVRMDIHYCIILIVFHHCKRTINQSLNISL